MVEGMKRNKFRAPWRSAPTVSFDAFNRTRTNRGAIKASFNLVNPFNRFNTVMPCSCEFASFSRENSFSCLVEIRHPVKVRKSLSNTLQATLLLLLGGCATPHKPAPTSPAQYTLHAERTVLLNLPGGERFDASGLLLTPNGDLLTISDRGPLLYRVEVLPDRDEANLIPLANCFTPSQLAPFSREKTGHYDCEGIAQDGQGRLYICEEANRWILRCDPKTARVERLPIDWSPVKNFFSADLNASFEGIAIGDGKLYVANERSNPVIIVVDLRSFKIIDHFQVYPQKFSLLGTHYSDLSWHDGKLFVLCRQHRAVVQVDPGTHAVLAEYDYRALEDQLGYLKEFPVGIMEGLAVSRDYFWLATDNNGLGRRSNPKDIRPTLLKCPRPDR